MKSTINEFNIGDKVTIHGYTEVHNDITAIEFRKTDQVWSYQVGGASWWSESCLKLINWRKL